MLSDEANKRFPTDKMAQMNWVLELFRGKTGDDLPDIVEKLRPGQRPASAEKSIDLAAATGASVDVGQAISKMKALEAKIKNAQWHFVYSTGYLERWDDFSSYKSNLPTRAEGNAVYDFEKDRYRIEVTGIHQPPPTVQSPQTPVKWVRNIAFDGDILRSFRLDGSNTPVGTIAHDSKSPNYSSDNPSYVLAKSGHFYLQNGSAYGLQTSGAHRLSQQLEMRNKDGQLKISQRDNGTWMITDPGRPMRIAYDPAKGATLGVQYLAPKGGGFFMSSGRTQRKQVLPPPGAGKSATAPPAPAAVVNEPGANRPSPSLFQIMKVLKIDLQQVGEFWLPKTTSNVSYAEANATSRIEISDIKINETLPSDIFKIEFPSGTVVHDQIQNKHYRVESPAPQIANSMPSGMVAPSQPMPTAAPVSPYNPSAAASWIGVSWYTLLLSTLSVAVLICLVLVIRQRARE